ncbi:malto-oligosyltrehalose trehalohydrolase [uncultured Reyranella sp.]|uniref:malto-oligosyltrehalose trehalohydrolase n=1 Tax=uncultured Reyranella sp. TaxID=735512 RepID=UPI0025FADB10|nr:malto-oligosyltrehalose trehalohydrolase [uncultured Reyranella sp.]
MKKQFMQDLSFGASPLLSGAARFRFWAPAQTRVSVEVEGVAPVSMRAIGDGWFEAEVSCGPGAQYLYRLANGLAVPDPASRAQADDVHGPSLVIDPRSYDWRHAGWAGRPWHETVLYELHVGAFGGFAGVQAALPILADLGVTAIELMPINDFPGKRNWGYDGVLPYAPDRSYGTPDELKGLVDSAHGLGLMMFLDVVYNHFGPDGNYLSAYAPQFFRDDIATPWGAAIDFRRPEVRRYFTENALYWLNEYRFDGLRFDAVHAISEADWLDEMAAEVRRSAEPGRQVHLVLEHDGNVADHLRRDFDAQWNDDAHHVLHALLTDENDGYYADYADKPAKRLARALAEGFVYQGDPSAYRNGETRGTPSSDLPPTSFVLFLQNHDQIGNRPFGDRLTERVEPDLLEAAIALQLLCPHVPMIFMGEEDAATSPFLYFTDHAGDLAEAVREGRRREFAGFKGFAPGEGTSSIPDPNEPTTFERSRLVPDAERGTGRHRLYRELLGIRREWLVPRLEGTGSLGASSVEPSTVVARWRLGDGATLVLASNLGREPAQIERVDGDLLYESRPGAADAARGGRISGATTVALMVPAP